MQGGHSAINNPGSMVNINNNSWSLYQNTNKNSIIVEDNNELHLNILSGQKLTVFAMGGGGGADAGESGSSGFFTLYTGDSA